MQLNRAHRVSWVLIGIGICGCAVAAEALPPTLRACMSETDSSRRLACFDRESARLVEQSAPVARQADPPVAAPVATAPAGAASAAVASAPARPAEDKFGYRGNIARAELDKQEAEAKKEFDQLTAKVAELGTLPHGELVLTLDNGQEWQQKPGDRGLRVRVGDEVTIKRASLGSFLLSSSGAKGVMRVSRVK
ncbi:MAG TPA: hypothetical protein VJQ52_03495 [Steroidobacteraceae bacterium]|nr:hypothetical protein [Steroidobacteraceae bacterium]